MQVVQRRKSLIALAAILLGVIAVVPVSIPRAHADDSSEKLYLTGFTLRNVQDPYFNTQVDAIQIGSSLTFTLDFVAANYGNFQRNITMGVKFDWMNNFYNTSTPVPVAMNQEAIITLSYAIPNTPTLTTTLHSWVVEVWDLNAGTTWTNTSCYDTGTTSCRTFYNYDLVNPDYNQIAVYSSTQANAMETAQQANAEILALSTILGATKNPPAGSSAAVADLAQAATQYELATNSYQTGNFNTAQTEYQASLNDANAAQSSLSTEGGGTDAATMTSIWLSGVAVIMGGIGALLLGFGGFRYLRGKTRALNSYTPSSTPKP